MATEWTLNLADYFACIPQTERNACWSMMSPTLIPPNFVLASVIDAIFAAQGQIDPETRREAWEAMYLMTRTEIEVEEETLTVYFADRKWCIDLYEASQNGKISLLMPRCAAFDYINQP